VGERIRVCVCGTDEDLRAWIVEELRLMTWIGEVELSSVASLADAPVQLELVILGSDGLTQSDLERIAARRRTTPVIAVGNTVVAAERTFGPRLTSRELKQAIRELVFVPRHAAAPAP
jgi:hypothetical protein